MDIIGVIAEYNPFHNGHIYQIEKIKEMYKDATIIVVMSSSFTERGLPSIINKWDKTSLALKYGVDMVVELPFAFATQSADIFAKGAIKLLKELHVQKIVFGSESNDVERLKKLADIQLNDKSYQEKVKLYLDKGFNYPTALSKALIDIDGSTVSESNDLLALSYIKEIIKQNANMEIISIKRTNNYLSKVLDSNIASATSIREAIKNKKEISNYIPKEEIEILNKNIFFIDDYFNLLKYKINTTDDLSIYLDVDEGIDNRIKKFVNKSNNIEELTEFIKSKRYTYNKINRMFIHILCSYTKEKNKSLDINYIRVLGFSKKGQKYLNKIKKEVELPLLTKYDKILDDEFTITTIYASVLDTESQNKLITAEYKNKVIRS